MPWFLFFTLSLGGGGNKVTEAAAPAESQASRSHEKEGRAISNSYLHHTDEDMRDEILMYAFKISAHACFRWVLLGFAHMMLCSPRESGRRASDTTTPSPEARSRAAKSSRKFPTYFFWLALNFKTTTTKWSVVCLECKVQRIGWLKNSLWAKCGVLLRPAVPHISEFHSNYKINNDYVAFTSSEESRIWDSSVLLLWSPPPIAGAQTQGCVMPATRMLCPWATPSSPSSLVFLWPLGSKDLTFKTLRVINYEV